MTTPALTADESRLLRTYLIGPRIWDAPDVFRTVVSLTEKGMVTPDGPGPAHTLTDQGRAALATATADRHRTTGWAWGTTDEGQWLTIAGSALDTARLAEHPEDAVPPAPIIGSTQMLARVERCDIWFRIIEMAPAAAQHRLIVVPATGYRDMATGWCTCSTWNHNGRVSVFETGWRFDVEASRADLAAAYTREHTERTVTP